MAQGETIDVLARRQETTEGMLNRLIAAQIDAQAHQVVVHANTTAQLARQAVAHANTSAQLANLIRVLNASESSSSSSSSSSGGSNEQVLGQSSDAHITKVPKQLRPEDQQAAEVIVGDLILEGPVAPDGFACDNFDIVLGHLSRGARLFMPSRAVF